jgi:4-hydroxy-tetrahydrodipicolinate synthase
MRRGVIDCDFTRASGPALDRYDRAELDALLARLSDLLPREPALA